MSRRTDTHCQQGKNTGPRTPQGWGGNKRWIQRPGGEEGWIHPLSVWRGASKKKCDTSSWFFGGDPSMFGAWSFWTPDVFFFRFFCIFVILLCFGLKKDSSYKHPDFYANLIHPSPLPWAYNDFTAKRQHKEKTPRTNSRKKTLMQIKGKK